MFRKLGMKVLTAAFLVTIGGLGGRSAAQPPQSPATENCLECHIRDTPLVFNQWQNSAHAQGSIGCHECHRAAASDPDAWSHGNTVISVLVTPKDCSHCHMDEVKEFWNSKHAEARSSVTGVADVPLGELGPLLADYILGKDEDGKTDASTPAPSPAAISGCLQCHGGTVKVGDDGKFEVPTWPNTGIGRVNPDGSKGRCSACHSTHEFSLAEARRPEACEFCHGGWTASNVAESYRSSLHGVMYSTGGAASGAPTCAGCHMRKPVKVTVVDPKAPNGKVKVVRAATTHDVGWTLPPSNAHANDCELATAMIQVCSTCHFGSTVDNFVKQFKAECKLVSDKWQATAKDLYCQAIATIKTIKEKEGEKYVPNTYPINYLYLEYTSRIKQAKRAAAMMSPRHTDQANTYLAEAFFGELVPELREIIRGADQGATKGTKNGGTGALKKALEKTLAESTYGPGWPHGKKALLEDCSDVTKEP